tara:strand:+ start:5640 stop:5966 length:327 start_codon:yes stop_codon:yes gene_type:complete
MATRTQPVAKLQSQAIRARKIERALHKVDADTMCLTILRADELRKVIVGSSGQWFFEDIFPWVDTAESEDEYWMQVSVNFRQRNGNAIIVHTPIPDHSRIDIRRFIEE